MACFSLCGWTQKKRDTTVRLDSGESVSVEPTKVRLHISALSGAEHTLCVGVHAKVWQIKAFIGQTTGEAWQHIGLYHRDASSNAVTQSTQVIKRGTASIAAQPAPPPPKPSSQLPQTPSR